MRKHEYKIIPSPSRENTLKYTPRVTKYKNVSCFVSIHPFILENHITSMKPNIPSQSIPHYHHLPFMLPIEYPPRSSKDVDDPFKFVQETLAMI